MEMDQKIEEVSAKIIALQQKNMALEDKVKQKTAKRQKSLSKMTQELQELNEKVSRAQQKNEELKAAKEKQQSHITQLEISIQDVANDRDSLKNNVLHLQQAADEARKKKQALSEGLEQTKVRTVDLEVANRKLDSELEQRRNVKLDLISQLGHCELEMKNMDGILFEIQDACGKRQEDIKRLQEQLQAKQLEQETLTSEYKMEITEMMMGIELEKKKSHDLDSELQREEQVANELLDRLKEIRTYNSSTEQQCQMLEENIAKTRSRTEELQALANEEVEREEKKVVDDLKGVEISLHELQNSVAESDKIHEEFILKVTKEKSEADEELENAHHGLQNSIASHDCMVQETMKLVNESRQSYAQHIDMKDAALTACNNEFHALTKQVEEASAAKDRREAKKNAVLKKLEVTVNELEEKLAKKRAEHELQVASSPVSLILSQSKQVSSSGGEQCPRGILKSPITESLVRSKKVNFYGLNSDSKINLSYSPQLIDTAEDISKEARPRKFFKSRSQPSTDTRL